jgi:hypothetical protein
MKWGLVGTPPAILDIEAGDAQKNENNKLDDEDDSAASKMFLEMVHFDEKPHPDVPGGRLYTYVITLQGEWRFTETGPEFKMDFLSKHSMHSDVAKEVAFAGEFFVRRRRGEGGMKMNGEKGKNHRWEKEDQHQGKEDEIHEEIKTSGEFEEPGFEAGAADPKKDDNPNKEKEISNNDNDDSSQGTKRNSFEMSNKASHSRGKSRDPSNFVLIIDNDSGTYRPDSKTLPQLQKYLERNLPGLKIKAMASDDKRLKKWKEEQKPKKDVQKAKKIAQQSSSCSASSSEDEAARLDT